MRISDWSSDVCSSDLPAAGLSTKEGSATRGFAVVRGVATDDSGTFTRNFRCHQEGMRLWSRFPARCACLRCCLRSSPGGSLRSEEHTSELQSLMRISYAVFCLKNKKNIDNH